MTTSKCESIQKIYIHQGTHKSYSLNHEFGESLNIAHHQRQKSLEIIYEYPNAFLNFNAQNKLRDIIELNVRKFKLWFCYFNFNAKKFHEKYDKDIQKIFL